MRLRISTRGYTRSFDGPFVSPFMYLNGVDKFEVEMEFQFVTRWRPIPTAISANRIEWHSALWSRTTKSQDISTGSLAGPFACLLTLLIHSLLCTACFAHAFLCAHTFTFLLACSLACSRARGKEVFFPWYEYVDFIQFWTILWKSHLPD